MESSSGVWSLKKIRKDESLWEEAQKKTFCGWINMHLAKRNIRVQDLSADLSDGVKLIALLEILHGSTIEGRYYRNPKSKPYKIDNVNFALNFITDTLKIQLISCSAEDVVDGNTKIILGMCWRLIQKFQLSQENSRAVLLNWCKQLASKYSLLIENFQSSFDNGLAFCALIHYYNNSLLDYAGLKPENKLHNLNLAFSLAEEHMEIPQLLDATDISNGIVDERSIMTYLSMIHHAISLKVPSDSGNGETERVIVPSIPIIRTGSFNPSEQVVVNTSASVAAASKPQSPPDNSHLYAEIANLKEKVTFLEAQISTSAAAERELQSQLESSRRDLANAIAKAKELENQLESANQQNSNLVSQLRSVEQQLASKSDHETSKELETRSEPEKKPQAAQETQEDSTKDESKTETTKGDDSSTDDDSKQEVTDDSKTQQSEEPSSKQEPKPAEPAKVEAAAAEKPKEEPKEEPKAPEPAKVEEPVAEKPKEEVKEVKVEEPVAAPAQAVAEQKEEPKELPKEQATQEEPAKVVETKAEEAKSEVKVEVPSKVEEQTSAQSPKAPAEVSKDVPPSSVPQLSSSEQEKLVADLQNEIAETREKLRQQVKVSETLQKSLEDTREEIVLIQKRQKRTQDKALKKQQKKYEKRIQRRDREIENLKKNAQVELQQKTDELASVNKQLKKAQKALGTTVAPHTSALDADIEYLKQQKDQLYEIVQLFEEEEKAMAKKSTRRIEDEEEKGERSEETEA